MNTKQETEMTEIERRIEHKVAKLERLLFGPIDDRIRDLERKSRPRPLQRLRKKLHV
jgi:hypothetical protein